MNFIIANVQHKKTNEGSIMGVVELIKQHDQTETTTKKMDANGVFIDVVEKKESGVGGVIELHILDDDLRLQFQRQLEKTGEVELDIHF